MRSRMSQAIHPATISQKRSQPAVQCVLVRDDERLDVAVSNYSQEWRCGMVVIVLVVHKAVVVYAHPICDFKVPRGGIEDFPVGFEMQAGLRTTNWLNLKRLADWRVAGQFQVLAARPVRSARRIASGRLLSVPGLGSFVDGAGLRPSQAQTHTHTLPCQTNSGPLR